MFELHLDLLKIRYWRSVWLTVRLKLLLWIRKDFFEVAYSENFHDVKPSCLGYISSTTHAKKNLVRQFESKYLSQKLL